ncbi:hypothetical protein BH23CHL5_BH23CHL5_24830 [soil metagenome]
MRKHVILVLTFLTGATGPLKRAFDWLRARGLGERVIKSALAAMLAFWLARFLPDNTNPILAPLTAIFSINLTIAGSMTDAWQRILGVMAGVLFALLVHEALGPGAIAIGLIVLVSFYLGRRLGLEASGVQQMAVSALLVVLGAAGSQVDNVAFLHLANTLIGTAVGLVLNASVAPPNHVPAAREQLHTLGHSIVAVLIQLQGNLATGIDRATTVEELYRARDIVGSLHDVDSALINAENGLAYNLLGTDQREVIAIYRQINRAMEHAAIQTRIVARSLTDAVASAPDGKHRPTWLEPDNLGGTLADLIDQVLVAFKVFLQPLDDADPAKPVAVSTEGINTQRDHIYAAALNGFESLLPDGWILLGEIVGVMTQLVTDLQTVSNEVLDQDAGRQLQWWRTTVDTVTWWRDD